MIKAYWTYRLNICKFLQLCLQIEDCGMALQFLATVCDEETFCNRPKLKPQKEDIIEYALQEEIMKTAKQGSYSGGRILIRHIMHLKCCVYTCM